MYVAQLDFNVPVLSVTLEAGDTVVCMNLSLLEDEFVEGTEHVELAAYSNDPNIFLYREIYALIVIEDRTGKCSQSYIPSIVLYYCLKSMFLAVFEVQFESSVYTVSERVGSLDLCLQSLNHSQIAPNLNVPLLLEELSDEPLSK